MIRYALGALILTALAVGCAREVAKDKAAPGPEPFTYASVMQPLTVRGGTIQHVTIKNGGQCVVFVAQRPDGGVAISCQWEQPIEVKVLGNVIADRGVQ